MTQQVIITSDASVAVLPLIRSAIQTELSLLALGIQRTSQRLQRFEDQYNMASSEFERRFFAGQLGDTLDFIEWAGEIKTLKVLQSQRRALQEVQLN